jgi:hypothetical protein
MKLEFESAGILFYHANARAHALLAHGARTSSRRRVSARNTVIVGWRVRPRGILLPNTFLDELCVVLGPSRIVSVPEPARWPRHETHCRRRLGSRPLVMRPTAGDASVFPRRRGRP